MRRQVRPHVQSLFPLSPQLSRRVNNIFQAAAMPAAFVVAAGEETKTLRQTENKDLEMELDISIKRHERVLRAELALQAREHRQTAEGNDGDMMCLISAMGGNGRNYRREATQRLRAVVAKVYSVHRVIEAAKRHPRWGLLPGLALDLTGHDNEGMPWEFNDPDQRKKADGLMDVQEPILLIIGSPVGTAFSHVPSPD